MKEYYKNPRTITQGELEDLEGSLDDLGDLGGVVHDLNSDMIIGGNQRGKVFDINECEIEITIQYDEPDRQGTVAHGFVKWHGHRYAYRQVRWTPEQCEEANIRANKAGGTWDWQILAEQWNYTDLGAWGFTGDELDEHFGVEDGSEAGAGEDTEAQADKAQELLEKWQVKTGDLWQLGAHRLICGDCTDAAVVARVMGGERADMCLTSPPYNSAAGGMKYDYSGESKRFYKDESMDKKTVDEWLILCDRALGSFVQVARNNACPPCGM